MQVTCTNCRARYAVDPLSIGPSGRIVQCARCNDRWFQTVKLEPTPARAAPPPESSFPAANTEASTFDGPKSEGPKPDDPKPSGPMSAASHQSDEPHFGSPHHRTVSPFSAESMSGNFQRFAGPRPPPTPDRAFIDTMPIPDMVIRPSMKGSGLPALIEPKTSRRMSIVLATALLLIVAAGAAVFVFRTEITAMMPGEWRTMLRLSP